MLGISLKYVFTYSTLFHIVHSRSILTLSGWNKQNNWMKLYKVRYISKNIPLFVATVLYIFARFKDLKAHVFCFFFTLFCFIYHVIPSFMEFYYNEYNKYIYEKTNLLRMNIQVYICAIVTLWLISTKMISPITGIFIGRSI